MLLSLAHDTWLNRPVSNLTPLSSAYNANSNRPVSSPTLRWRPFRTQHLCHVILAVNQIHWQHWIARYCPARWITWLTFRSCTRMTNYEAEPNQPIPNRVGQLQYTSFVPVSYSLSLCSRSQFSLCTIRSIRLRLPFQRCFILYIKCRLLICDTSLLFQSIPRTIFVEKTEPYPFVVDVVLLTLRCL